ncbi:MAG TPA: hypothetical protein VNP72_01260 [Longimicrobium sp.]|nr:hypothetical protein [Longimicrobium sp.]
MNHSSLLCRSLCALALTAAAACESPSGTEAEACGGATVWLEVGQAVALSPGEEPCSLAAGAEYVLAYLDARGLEMARAGNETYVPAGPGVVPDQAKFAVRITVDGPAAAVASRGAAVEAHAGPAAGMDADLAAAGPSHATSPFGVAGAPVPGDTFSVDVPCIGCTVNGMLTFHATVAAVHDDWLTVAAVDGLPEAQLATYLETLRAAWPTARTHALPLLQHALAPGVPRTSPAGRLLVLVEPDLGTFSGYAQTAVDEDQVYGYVRLKLEPGVSQAWLAGLVAHELTHLYQRMHNHRTRTGNSTTGLGAALWGAEGTADLVWYETIRRAGGLPLLGNYDWRVPGADPFANRFMRYAQPSNAEFARGYTASMGFLRRLVAQRVASGESVDDAMREGVRGGIQGWFGNDGRGSIRPGLASRMAARLGGWKPEAAMLEWTLSHAADDLTPSPRYQDPTFLRVGDIPAGYEPAWRPDHVISGGGTFTVQRRWGGSGYTLLHAGASGLRFRAVAETPGVHWMLLRVR